VVDLVVWSSFSNYCNGSVYQSDKSVRGSVTSWCTLTQYGTDRKHGQSLVALGLGFYTQKNHGQSQTKAWAVAPSPRYGHYCSGSVSGCTLTSLFQPLSSAVRVSTGTFVEHIEHVDPLQD